MRILVTGGNGYVGRTVTRRLYREHQVSVLDNLRHGRLRFSREEEGCFALFRADIRDFAAVERVVAETQPEVLIHLAAIHYIPECERHPDEAIAVNTLGTSNLLRACAGHPLCVRLDRRSLRRLRHAARGVLEPRRARGHLRPDQAPRGELRPVLGAERTGWTRGSCACST